MVIGIPIIVWLLLEDRRQTSRCEEEKEWARIAELRPKNPFAYQAEGQYQLFALCSMLVWSVYSCQVPGWLKRRNGKSRGTTASPPWTGRFNTGKKLRRTKDDKRWAEWIWNFNKRLAYLPLGIRHVIHRREWNEVQDWRGRMEQNSCLKFGCLYIVNLICYQLCTIS